jgi:hypothetical protein
VKKPVIIRVCLLGALFLVGAVLFYVARPPLGSPAMAGIGPIGTVTFLGYTDDGYGTRLAKFAVTNLSDIVVARSAKCLIWIANPGGGWTPHSVVLLGGHLLAAGEAETVTITPPAVPSAWRASFYLCNEPGAVRVINAARRLIHLPNLWPVATRQIDSERIEARK